MSIPSWARKGAKVVCVDTVIHEEWRAPGHQYTNSLDGLVEGEIYEIREVVWDSIHNNYGLHIVGIVRPRGGTFHLARFRPVLDIKDDAEVEMALYYKKGLHQSVPRKKSVDA